MRATSYQYRFEVVKILIACISPSATAWGFNFNNVIGVKSLAELTGESCYLAAVDELILARLAGLPTLQTVRSNFAPLTGKGDSHRS